MTIKELIEKLKAQPPDAVVYFYDDVYGEQEVNTVTVPNYGSPKPRIVLVNL